MGASTTLISQIMMAKVDAFLDALINYDKENIHPEIIKAIQPYLNDAEFEPEFVRSKSAAAAGTYVKKCRVSYVDFCYTLIYCPFKYRFVRLGYKYN